MDNLFNLYKIKWSCVTACVKHSRTLNKWMYLPTLSLSTAEPNCCLRFLNIRCRNRKLREFTSIHMFNATYFLQY